MQYPLVYVWLVSGSSYSNTLTPKIPPGYVRMFLVEKNKSVGLKSWNGLSSLQAKPCEAGLVKAKQPRSAKFVGNSATALHILYLHILLYAMQHAKGANLDQSI